MAEPLKRLWKFLNTDIGDLFSAETVKGGVESAKAVLELAKTLKEQGSNVGQLAPLVGQISTLLDVLNSPLVQVVGAGLPFVSIATGLLTFYLDKSKQEPTLALCVALVSQGAYLESLKAILALSENQTLLEKIGKTLVSEPVEKQIKKLGELELDDSQAKKAIVCFHESKLAEEFNQVLVARLQQAGLDATEAQTLSQRVAWNTARYINQVIADAADKVKPLAELYRTGGRELLEKYQSIDTYLEEQIATKPLETVFLESFTFKDIYVPLKAKPVDRNGDIDRNAKAFGLETWAKDILNDPQKQAQVMFIQGGPGRGKSVFCRMFADLVRQQLHPIWTPVLIRLREIAKLQQSFRATLQEAVQADFAASDDGWLTDRNTRFLFLLDGFDELVMEGRTSGLEEFLKQVGQFQQDCQRSKDMGHRVLITGRSLALHAIERFMPPNLERVEIQPMDDELQQQWFIKWETIVDRDKTIAKHKTKVFQEFLQDQRCPEQVQELAREPLLLYLLAAMHRDGKLTVEMFEGVSAAGAKILIYQTSLKWVLEEQRPEWLNRQMTAMETAGLQCILAEAALCVVHSGGECASIKMLKERIKDNDSAAKLIKQAQARLGDDALKNALAAFYLQPAKSDRGGSVEFAHKSFSEFLFAQRLKESLEEWTEPGRRGEEFLVKKAQMDWEIYDLLGYGGLTPEIVEYLMALLTTSLTQEGVKEGESRSVQLFNRLEDFYFRWCEGEFIDIAKETLPQKKTHKLKEQGIELGQRQVDVYAGLNVMILLLELHRYALSRDDLKAQIAFYPCGQKDTEDFDNSRLLRIIGYSDCIGISSFLKIVGQFLSGAVLSGAVLSGAVLSGAVLSGAVLNSAYLTGTVLIRADLSGADLRSANLSHAVFRSADLRHADLTGADLSHADLTGADLRGADLRGADLHNADLSSADLSSADLHNAVLRHAVLSSAALSHADLTSADLIGANLSHADLSHAVFRSADLIYADLHNAVLTGADLTGAVLSSAVLSSADLRSANLSHADLRSANLSHADLRSAVLTGAVLSSAVLSSAVLRHAVLTDADLSSAVLSSADLRHAVLRSANLTGAVLKDVIWDNETRWDDVRGLETAVDVPDALKQKLRLG